MKKSKLHLTLPVFLEAGFWSRAMSL